MTKKRGQVPVNHTDEWLETDTNAVPTAAEVNEAIQQIFRDEAAPEPEPVAMIELTSPELIERVVAQMVSEAKAQDEAGRAIMYSTYAHQVETWNRVFFVIKQLKPLMASSPALKGSKLGALLEKLPK